MIKCQSCMTACGYSALFLSYIYVCTSQRISHFSSSLESGALKRKPVCPRNSSNFREKKKKKLRSASIWLKVFQFCVYAAHHRNSTSSSQQNVFCSSCYGKRGLHPPPPTPKWQLGDHANVNRKSPEDGTSSNDTTEGGNYKIRHKHKYEWARNGRPQGTPVFSLINNANSGPPFLISISVLSKPSLRFWPTVILAYSAKSGPQSSTLYPSSTHSGMSWHTSSPR